MTGISEYHMGLFPVLLLLLPLHTRILLLLASFRSGSFEYQDPAGLILTANRPQPGDLLICQCITSGDFIQNVPVFTGETVLL